MDKQSAEVIRNTAAMFEFLKCEMRSAAQRGDDIVIQFLRMQMFLIDEAMFDGWRDAKRSKQNEQQAS